ncbi:MAG: RIP metalloprotease RseP [Kiritimatiellae bacterium]|nr:RIP metalloprotease RseP [Kiritimatiellia bacterium]
MLTAILMGLSIALLFGLTVFIHELGHFWVARWCGLKIEAFSIGFGPALWKKTIRGVKYKIGLLPFGGYVALPQMDPTFGLETPKKDDDTPPLLHISPFKKILVGSAGVIMNMIFAVFIAYIVYWTGMPSVPDQHNTVVGYVDPTNPIYDQGLRIGDEITEINGVSVSNWQEILTECVLHDEITLHIKSKGSTKEIVMATEQLSVGKIDARPAISGENFCKVLSVQPGSSAEKAGIKSGDLIVSLNNQIVHSQSHLISLVDKHRNQEVSIQVKRNQDIIPLKVTPAYYEKDDQVRIGIMFNNYWKDNTLMIHPKPSQQIQGHAKLIFRVLKALVTPKTAKKAGQNIGGPFAIIYMLWLMISSSFMVAIWFTGLINVNLAIINLLPIPILDGGHIMFSFSEMITGKRIHPKVMLIVSNIFFVLIVSLFLFLSFRDFKKLIIPSIKMKNAASAAQESGTNAPSGQPSGETE